jgi:hypothetical protein
MSKLTPKQEKYLEHKLALIRASIYGTIAGIVMFGIFNGKSNKISDNLFKQVEKDIQNIVKYFNK